MNQKHCSKKDVCENMQYEFASPWAPRWFEHLVLTICTNTFKLSIKIKGYEDVRLNSNNAFQVQVVTTIYLSLLKSYCSCQLCDYFRQKDMPEICLKIKRLNFFWVVHFLIIRTAKGNKMSLLFLTFICL